MLDSGTLKRTCAVLAVAAGLIGCGGTMAFSDSSSLAIVGDGPAPPPPEVKPEPPPKPKRVEVKADKIEITEKIQFDYNKTTIKPESHELLNEIVSVIKENDHIKKLAIVGHTDGDGSDKYNLKLSDGRAQAVLKYLTSHGIDADRLAAKGLGETKPLAENDTDEGKEKNRRVEFLITDQDKVTKTYEIDPKTGERKEVETKEVESKEKDK